MSNIQMHMTEEDHETYRTWFQQFKTQQRSTIVNRLINALANNSGTDTILAVLKDIERQEIQRQRWNNPEDKYNNLLLEVIETDPQGSREAFNIIADALFNKRKGNILRKPADIDRPPTPKQLAFLSRKGIQHNAKTVGEAAALIGKIIGGAK